jgi:hypothetical protein
MGSELHFRLHFYTRNLAYRTPGDLCVPDPCEGMRYHRRRGAT